MEKEFDLIVIGGGSGGIAAAIQAAKFGVKVALIEGKVLGGTCVNTGCVPKKIMWFAASCAINLSSANAYGFTLNNYTFDWKKLVSSRHAFIQKLHGIFLEKLQSNQVTYIQGFAERISDKTIRVGDQLICASHIIIATGGMPTMPNIPGAQLGINSDDFFALKEQPKEVVIVGAGYIAVELASLLQALGTRVKLVLRKKGILCQFDKTITEHLYQLLQKQGIEILTYHVAQQVKKENGKLHLYCKENKIVRDIECLIWAVGRHANTTDLKLNEIGIELTQQGYIKTNRYQNTNIPTVYAIGDVTGKKALTPVAIAEGRHLATRLFGNAPEYFDYQFIPSVIFSHPPVAAVGLTEEKAIEKYGIENLEILKKEFTPLSQILQHEPIKTVMKLIMTKKGNKIIGCHLCGEGVDEMLQGITIAINMGATLKDLNKTLPVHPTSSEELVLM